MDDPDPTTVFNIQEKWRSEFHWYQLSPLCFQIQNFQEFLSNIFEPLFAATFDPQGHPEVYKFMDQVAKSFAWGSSRMVVSGRVGKYANGKLPVFVRKVKTLRKFSLVSVHSYPSSYTNAYN